MIGASSELSDCQIIYLKSSTDESSNCNFNLDKKLLCAALAKNARRKKKVKKQVTSILKKKCT